MLKDNLDATQTWYLNYTTIDTCHGLFRLFEVIDDCSFLKYWLNYYQCLKEFEDTKRKKDKKTNNDPHRRLKIEHSTHRRLKIEHSTHRRLKIEHSTNRRLKIEH